MTENPPINNDGKVPTRSRVAHPTRVPGSKVDAQTLMASVDSHSAPSLSPQPEAPNKRLLPWLVAVAFFMESLDTTILNTAVPAISAALHVAPLSMKSVLASYTLSLAVFIPISGWMADRFGTRRVFASAIGLFTLGSFLCGISSNIHLLVACRILQGCGGAMMVPVGRLTLVRTFAKSELIRAMSFVAIPGLVGPMLGPVAGGLIVGYFHWRLIFFLNIPIGILGLLMVYLHLPDYREEHTHPLDIVGLILFGSGIALLSYVLEIFGEHALSVREILGLLIISLSLLAGYLLHARGTAFPLLQLNLFRIRTFSAAVSGSFFHPSRHRRSAVPLTTPLPGGSWVYPHRIRSADCTPGDCSHEHQVPHAEDSGPGWLPWCADVEYRHPRPASAALRYHWTRHARLADRAAGILLWDFQLAAIHQHEYAGLRRHQ
jgi:MFS family permease